MIYVTGEVKFDEMDEDLEILDDRRETPPEFYFKTIKLGSNVVTYF